MAPAKATPKAAKATGRKLKVFQATLGFYETVIAVPSQAAALRAWGTSQNLFKDGTALPSEDEQATAAALEKPGVVLRRAIGTKGPFGVDPGVPNIPDLPAKKSRSSASKRKEADRRALDRATGELEQIEDRRRDELARFEKRRRQLEADEAEAENQFQAARDKAQERVERERRIIIEAGGKLKA